MWCKFIQSSIIKNTYRICVSYRFYLASWSQKGGLLGADIGSDIRTMHTVLVNSTILVIVYLIRFLKLKWLRRKFSHPIFVSKIHLVSSNQNPPSTLFRRCVSFWLLVSSIQGTSPYKLGKGKNHLSKSAKNLENTREFFRRIRHQRLLNKLNN